MLAWRDDGTVYYLVSEDMIQDETRVQGIVRSKWYRTGCEPKSPPGVGVSNIRNKEPLVGDQKLV